jgi:uncharacterized surface protein with fasciclin (FAS1) repeats
MKAFSSFTKALTVAFTVMCLAAIVMQGCKREPLVIETSSQVNITSYFEKYPEQFSEWSKILDLTGNAGFLQAYGTYTMFAPTNDGVAAYLKSIGKSSIEEVPLNDLKDIVKFSLLEDTIPSTQFSDGKLDRLTMLGQYLITGTSSEAGVTKVVINRQANIVKADIRLGNGLLHIIDNILLPSKLTVAQIIEANPDYSIFTEGLKETGLYDSLNIAPELNPKSDQKFLTVIAESNEVLAAAGYPTYAALKTKYNTGNPDLKDAANGLHAFFAYHVLSESKYLADLASAPAHKTISLPEIISTQYLNQNVVLNDVEFNGAYEPGFSLDRAHSDVSASNGVVHAAAPFAYNHTYEDSNGNTVTATGTTSGHFDIKVRVPFSVFWDVADFKEARALPIFRKGVGGGGKAFTKVAAADPSPIAGWAWPKKGDGVTYNNSGGAADAWVNGDYLNMFLGIVAGNARQEWIDMKTPVIVRGKYHVWVCYRRQNQSGTWPTRVGTTARVRIDGGDPSTKVFHFAEPIPLGSTAELESLGWKYYTSNGDGSETPWAKQTYGSNGSPNSNPWISKDLGVMEVKTTDFHTLRLEAVYDSQSTNNLDMIMFIPIEAPSQILPRFMKDGTPDYTPYTGI